MRYSYYIFFAVIMGFVTAFAGAEGPHDSSPLSEELAKRIQQSRRYDPELVTELEQARKKASDPMKQAAFDLFIAGQQGRWGSPVGSATVRAKLEELADSFPGTWISVMAKLSIAGVHLSRDAHRERVEILRDVLADPGLDELRDSTNPFLASFHQDKASKEVAANPRDFIRFLLVGFHSQVYDLSSAEATAEQIQSEHWRAKAASQLGRLRAMDPEARQRARERSNEAQKAQQSSDEESGFEEH